MGGTAIALIAFVCIFSGALLGLHIRTRLPDHHLNDATREVVKLASGLIATLAALVLGLLVSSAKGSLDSITEELTQVGARVVLLDRVLDNYGPETKDARGILRNALATSMTRIWPSKGPSQVSSKAVENQRHIEVVQNMIRGLSPHSDTQRELRTQALQITFQLAQSRWIIIEQTQQTLPTAFLVVLLFWLAILFAGFGLLSPTHSTVLGIFFLCALSVSGAIFLILEMSTPFSGIVKVSSATMQKALEHLGR